LQWGLKHAVRQPCDGTTNVNRGELQIKVKGLSQAIETSGLQMADKPGFVDDSCLSRAFIYLRCRLLDTSSS
jgi:hypothetical protein